MHNDITIIQTLAKNLKKLRLMQKISQEELAFRCDLSKNYLSDVERGTRNITLKIVAKIAKGLNVEINELFKK